MKKILDNAYVLDFTIDLDISSTFNVANLYSFHEGIVDHDFLAY